MALLRMLVNDSLSSPYSDPYDVIKLNHLILAVLLSSLSSFSLLSDIQLALYRPGSIRVAL